MSIRAGSGTLARDLAVPTGLIRHHLQHTNETTTNHYLRGADAAADTVSEALGAEIERLMRTSCDNDETTDFGIFV